MLDITKPIYKNHVFLREPCPEEWLDALTQRLQALDSQLVDRIEHAVTTHKDIALSGNRECRVWRWDFTHLEYPKVSCYVEWSHVLGDKPPVVWRVQLRRDEDEVYVAAEVTPVWPIGVTPTWTSDVTLVNTPPLRRFGFTFSTKAIGVCVSYGEIPLVEASPHFRVGDIVRLKSGGPTMVVVKAPPDTGGQYPLKCTWFRKGRPLTSEFDDRTVELTKDGG